MKRLEDKVILIAGGAGGIGTATAERLAAEGACVVLGDVNIGEARSTASRLSAAGARVVATELDIAVPGSVKDFMDFAVRTYGGIDGLHANAALLAIQDQDTSVLDIDLEIWDRLLQVDLTGYMYCTRYALPHMLERGGGSFVYMSSGAATIGETVRIAYAVSKAGINALMRHVASGWGKQNIRANSVAPGLVESATVLKLPKEFRDYVLSMTRSPRLGKASDIANMVAMLMSPEGEWIQGQVISVNGGGQFN